MGKVLISPNYMTDIADAVRNKIGSTDKLTATQMAETILNLSDGLSLNVLAPGYSSMQTYSVGDLVTYQDAFYACSTAISSPESFDLSHWSKTTVAEELSTILKAGAADDKYY